MSSEEVNHGEKTDENEKLLQKEPFETDLNALFQLDEVLKGELPVVRRFHLLSISSVLRNPRLLEINSCCVQFSSGLNLPNSDSVRFSSIGQQ